MRKLTEDELKEIDQCGRVGFSYKEIAYCFRLPVSDVREQFVKEEGDIFMSWIHGRYQAELEIRQKVLDGAKNGSTPMVEKMLMFFKRTEEEHRDL